MDATLNKNSIDNTVVSRNIRTIVSLSVLLVKNRMFNEDRRDPYVLFNGYIDILVPNAVCRVPRTAY